MDDQVVQLASQTDEFWKKLATDEEKFTTR